MDTINPKQPLNPLETSDQPLQTGIRQSIKKFSFQLFLGVLALLIVIGGGAYYLNTQNIRTASYNQTQNTQLTTIPQNKSLITKVIAYRWNNELWTVEPNGVRKKLYTFQSNDVPYSKLFVTSDNKYIVWFSPKRGILRYNIANNSLDVVDAYDEQITLSNSFYNDLFMDGNNVYYLDTLKNQIVTVDIANGNKNEVNIPKKFNTFQLSPSKEKVLLGISHGGPASSPEHAVMNFDGSGYTDLPMSFERYGFFVRIWTNDSKSILQTKGSNELVAFDANSGIETSFTKLASNDDSIGDCRYIDNDLYCNVISASTQQSKWVEVKNGVTQASDFTLPKVSDNPHTVYYENGNYYVVEIITFHDDRTKDYYTLWLIDKEGNKSFLIEKFTDVSLPSI